MRASIAIQQGEVEVDESYFGPHHVRGKRGRGASGKTIVFGLLKRGDQVYTEIVPNCRKTTLQAIIRGRVSADAIIHSDGWRGYDGLVDVGYAKHYRVRACEEAAADGITNQSSGQKAGWSVRCSTKRDPPFHAGLLCTF